MPPMPQPAPSPVSRNPDAVVTELFAAMHCAAFEAVGEGGFRLISPPPSWLRDLLPEIEKNPDADLLDRFPFLESFLPEAEEVWKGARESASSDLWSESSPAGDVHLQAWALRTGLPVLVIAAADTLYKERQLVLQYAHDTALQYEVIKRLNEEVRQANQAKSDFLATMSHEIRTPMNAILGMADVLAETTLTREQRGYVSIFQRAATSLLDLINDILDLSKIEAGQLSLEKIAFDLRDIVGRATELAGIRAREKGLRIETHIGEHVPGWLVGDPVRLRQVLVNLLGNATKFTDQGKLEVRVEVEGPGLRFAVADTGIGIPAEKLACIFERFTQADSSTTRKYGGTGLGLAISKKLVEAMGGRIWAESTVGSGSTFFFTIALPLADAPPVAPKAREAAEQVAAMRILVADDSEDNRLVIRAYLKGSRHRLDFAEDGPAALEKLKTGTYDLALVDVHMPSMDGYEVVRQFREFERSHNRPALPVLALTADAMKEAVDKSMAAGFSRHLAKPIRKASLLQAIADHGKPGSEAPAAALREIVVDEELSAILPKYLANLRKNPAAIAAALARSDEDTIRSIGHNMKGTGTSFGLPEVTEFGDRLERAAKEHRTDEVRQVTDQLAHFLDEIGVRYR